MWPDDAPRKRTLGIKDKEHLWKREGKRCSNPACGRKLDFTEMQVGHKKAYSRGGSTAFSNLVSLCYPCNKLQGTDSWAVFLRKQGVTGAKTTATQAVKTKLQALTVTQLKALASKHGVKVTGSLVEDWFETKRKAPTKAQYITRLSKVLNASQVRAVPKPAAKKATAKKPAKRKRKSNDDFWPF